VLDQAALAAIRGRFEGDVLEAGDPGYDEARKLFNAMIDRKPRLIVRCTGPADVVAGVLLARETGLPLAVKGGGHGVNGHAACDDGIMLDLSPMKSIVVDPHQRTVVAQPGTDVVTADGRAVKASDDENADLFWGLRGGGGNFGVVTSFEYRLHELGPIVTGGLLLWPVEQAGDVLRFYREFIAHAPDEVGGGATIMTAPPAPFVPPELQGKRAVGVIACAFTDPERGEELLRPLREFRSPAVDIVGPMPYTAFQQMLDAGNPPGLYNYWKAELVEELTDELIDLSVAHGDKMAQSHSLLFFQPLGGQIARTPADSNAITARHAKWALHCIGVWETSKETEVELAWVKAWGPLIEPYRLAGIPMTFSADAGDERVRATYGDEKYTRLVALKDRYDPENLFRLNQNIKPSGSPA